MGKKTHYFVSALGNISVHALVIFITLSILIIFSNLTFLDTKQSGVQLVLEIKRVLGVQIRKSFVTIRDWSENIQQKPRSFSNEVSSNNAKSPLPDNWQKVSGMGIYKSILNPAVLHICKIGYFSMIEGSCTDLATVYTVFKHAQMATDVLEQHDLYCHLHPSKTNSNDVSRRIFEARSFPSE